MKRLIKIMACILSVIFFTISAGAYSVTSHEVRDENGDIVNHEGKHFSYFIKDDGTALITDFTDTIVMGKLVVPTLINGFVVTEIKAYSFGHVEAMTSLTIPGSVTYVGKGAFQNCRDLETVVIERGTEILDERVFAGCEVLSSIIIPDSITEFGAGIFEGCPPHMMIYYEGSSDEWYKIKKDESEFANIAVTFALSELPDYEPYNESNGFSYKIKSDKTVSLIEYTGAEKNVVIPSEIEGYPVSVIADSCFETRNDIISVEIPDTVREIGEKAFWYCRSLEQVILHDGLEIIGKNTFKNCEKLESITLPSTVSEIGDNAFEDCTALKEIIIPDSVETIGNRAFGDCESLEKITLGKGIRKMGEYCFANCEEITNAEIPDGITVVEASLFHNCKGLEYIVIPDSVEVIRGNAFFGCYKLERTLYKGSETEWKDIDIGINNLRLKDSIIIYNYDPATYKPAGPEVAITLCCIAALVPVVVAVIFIIRRKRVCPDCGKKIEDNSKFCGGCGREL